MEAHRGGAGERAYERAKVREGARGIGLVEEANRGGDAGFGIPWGKRRCGGELALGRDRPTEPLERDAIEELAVRVAAASASREERELARGRESPELGRDREPGHEDRPSAEVAGVQQVLGLDRGGRVGIDAADPAPLRERLGVLPRPEESEPEVEPHEAAPRMLLLQTGELGERPVRPLRERRAHLRLQRVDPGFRPERVLSLQITAPASKYPQPVQIADFFRQVTDMAWDSAGNGAFVQPQRLKP